MQRDRERESVRKSKTKASKDISKHKKLGDPTLKSVISYLPAKKAISD